MEVVLLQLDDVAQFMEHLEEEDVLRPPHPADF
jgi:hypothetical protein